MFFRIRFQQVNAIASENDIVWTFGLSGTAANEATTAALADVVLDELTDVQASGLSLAAQLQPLNPLYAESFESTGGPAVAVVDLGPALNVGTGTLGPTEVQLVASRRINTPRGESPIGRFYFGPVGANATSGALRPSVSGIVATLGQFMQGIHAGFVTLGRTPVVVRQQGTLSANTVPITSYAVDDAWDTQRRRGVEPTVTTAFSV